MHLIDTKMEKGHWIDADYRMLYGMMNLLKDFVEEEKCFEHVVYDDTDEHIHAASEIRAIYEWWNNYQYRLDEINEQLDVWYKASRYTTHPNPDNIFDSLNISISENEKKESDKLHEMEQQLEKEEEEMLIRLVKIRRFLWV